MIFIDGVLQGGGSLMLPAALAPDRWSLLTQMPLEGGPLVAGNHTVMISLNGQQLPEQLEYSEAAVSVSQLGHENAGACELWLDFRRVGVLLWLQ